MSETISPYTTLAHYSIVAKIGAGGMHSNMSLLTERKKDSECTPSDKHILLRREDDNRIFLGPPINSQNVSLNIQ